MAKREKEKKDSNLLVILVMLILILLIALPPTFRMLFPKEEESESNSETDTTKKTSSVTSLSCRKTSTDGYSITVNTIYQNNDVSKITLSYIVSQNNNTTDTTTNNTTQPQNDETTNQAVQPQTTDTTHQVQDNTLAEIELLKAIPNIQANEADTSHQFQIEMKNYTYKTIPDNLTLRVQSLSLQRAFYENSGYACSVINN